MFKWRPGEKWTSNKKEYGMKKDPKKYFFVIIFSINNFIILFSFSLTASKISFRLFLSIAM